MKIDKPGVYDIPADAYHKDPCPTASLSNSIAKILITQSPSHAYHAHPRLGGNGGEMNSRRLDIGSIAHKLVLGKGRDIKVIDAKDYKGGAAKSERDLARAAGLLPALVCDYEAALAMSEIAHKEIHLNREVDAVFHAQTARFEEVAIWREGDAWCRSLMDCTDGMTILDYKSVTNASPDYVTKHIYNMGYHIQRAWYLRGLDVLDRAGRGRRHFIFICQEIDPPHAVTFHKLDGAGEAMGERLCDQAVNIWRQCMKQNKWPSYDRGIHYAQLPGWMESSILAKEIERDERKRRPGEFNPEILMAG